MKDETPIPAFETQTPLACRAEVILVHDEGSVSVICDGHEAMPLVCCILETIEGRRLQVSPGDLVLVVRDREESGIILGRIRPSNVADHASQAISDIIPNELLIEAKKNLTLKCGEGSITIREDGKILIKGKDLVSHAQRMNRIKGGSVSIN